MASNIVNKRKHRQISAKWMVTAIVLAVIVGLFFVAMKSVYWANYANSDFIAFWQSAQFIVNGKDPYDTAQWVSGIYQQKATLIYDDTFLYPISLAILFSPLLGHLPLDWMFVMWNWLSALLLLASILMLLHGRDSEGTDVKHYVMPLVLGTAVFRPVIQMMISGQLTAWLVFICTVVVYLWEREKWWQGGVLLSLLALKPGIGAPLIGLSVVWLLQKRKIAPIGSVVFTGLVLMGIGFLYDPLWLHKYLAIGSGKASLYIGRTPTIWGVAGVVCGNRVPCTPVLGGIAAAIAVAIMLVVIFKFGKTSYGLAMSGIVGVSVLVTPYLWAYDQTLLLLPVVFTTLAMKNRFPYLVSSVYFLMLDLFALICMLVATPVEHDGWNGLISLVVFILWTVFAVTKQRDL